MDCLVGNPNVGKSVVFQALTSIYVDVSNFPGTTLDISHGKWNQDLIIDTPGIYGVSSFTDEERVACEVILQADRIINVINAVNLDRDLFLTQHLIDTGKPVIVALNMMDEAKNKGVQVDAKRLSKQLGVPVVEIIATQNKGMDTLKNTIKQAQVGHPTPLLTNFLKEVEHVQGSQAEKVLLLEGCPLISERLKSQAHEKIEPIYSARRHHVNEILAQVITSSGSSSKLGTVIGQALIRPFVGIPFLLVVLLLMYQIIGVFVAEDVIELTEDIFMGEIYEPFIVSLFTDTFHLNEEGILGTILIGEFGLFTMTITYVFGLLLPLVFSFYLFLALFEDSGYLPRLATLVDRFMQKIGLNGRAIIPMILGLGCVTMATITTRLLGNDREKRIAIFLLGLAIPCSAQLAVIFALLAGVGKSYALLYFAALVLVLVVVGQILDSVLKGEATSLLIDIPPMRIPRPVNVLKKTTIKTVHFIREALPLFALGALVISVLQLTSMLDKISLFLKPLTVSWLGLPQEASTAFIMGIVRRDFGAAGLYDLSMSSAQTVVALLTITLFVPCIASVLIIFKERVTREAFIMWGGTFVISFTVGGLLHMLLNVFGGFSPFVQVLFSLLSMIFVGFIIKQGILLFYNKRSFVDDEFKQAS